MPQVRGKIPLILKIRKIPPNVTVMKNLVGVFFLNKRIANLIIGM
jgi:hypothetical protein